MRNGGNDSPPDISLIRLGGGAGVVGKDCIQCAKCHGGVFFYLIPCSSMLHTLPKKKILNVKP